MLVLNIKWQKLEKIVNNEFEVSCKNTCVCELENYDSFKVHKQETNGHSIASTMADRFASIVSV